MTLASLHPASPLRLLLWALPGAHGSFPPLPQGDVEAARGRYKHLLGSVAPRLVEAATSASNFERRQVRVRGSGVGFVS